MKVIHGDIKIDNVGTYNGEIELFDWDISSLVENNIE